MFGIQSEVASKIGIQNPEARTVTYKKTTSRRCTQKCNQLSQYGSRL